MLTAPPRERRSLVPAALATIAVAAMLPLSVFLMSAWLLGWQLLTVETASMEPTFPVGSLLVSTQVDPAAVRTGMAIVFEDPAKPGRLVTHRVVGIAPGEALAFWTQGDANPVRDLAPVPARLVRGHVLWQVPVLGRATELLQWPRSVVLLILVPAGLLIVNESMRRRQRTDLDGATTVVAGT